MDRCACDTSEAGTDAGFDFETLDKDKDREEWFGDQV
jgi:hypothetical protein